MRLRKVRNGRVEHAMDLGYRLSPRAYKTTREDDAMPGYTWIAKVGETDLFVHDAYAGCSAVVSDPHDHESWHERLYETLNDLDRTAT